MTSVFNSPTVRSPLSKDVPVWDAKLLQWVPTSQRLIYVDGALTSAVPIIATQTNTVTSTGAVGTYAITFAPVVFTIAPRVVAWCGKESGGNLVLLSLDGVSTTLFQFDMTIPASGAAVTAGHTVVVEWIAIGS